MSTTSTTIVTESFGSRAADETTDVDQATRRRTRVWSVGIAAGITAALATSLTAAVATAAGLDIEIGGEPIPASGFAVLTLIGALLGIAIAKVTQRTRHPRGVFITATVILTALSIIPDVVADATWPTRLLLAFTHVIAAAIVVPSIARRLDA